VGAGLAGATAAAQLRKEGSDAPIMLLGAEPEAPYDRPPLSKEYLRGEAPRENVALRGAAFYEEQAIDLRTSTRVASIDPAAQAVVLEDGERLGYERLLLATGSTPRHLDVPGAGLEGVHTLRTVEDSDALRLAAESARRAVVIGGGWIGSEVSASLRQLGLDVVMVVSDPLPLQRVLGPEVGRIYRDLHADHGVRLVLGRRVSAVLGSGSVETVVLDDDMRLPADLVVVGVGVEPRVGLARDAGLDVAHGVRADEHLETSVPGIFAAGDIAEAWHPWLESRIRVEHRENARFQGRTAGRNLLGMGEAYERLPFFYSDQYDLSMEYVGHAPTWDGVVLRGDVAARRFVALWLRDGRVVAGMSANVPDVNKDLERLIRSRRQIDPRRLTDTDIPLDEIDALAKDRSDSRPVGSAT
jgi:3-phenylpropionate/trans-cinnamate dioxygenase ferredoxin reductase component